jgi:hypothetical protein
VPTRCMCTSVGSRCCNAATKAPIALDLWLANRLWIFGFHRQTPQERPDINGASDTRLPRGGPLGSRISTDTRMAVWPMGGGGGGGGGMLSRCDGRGR